MATQDAPVETLNLSPRLTIEQLLHSMGGAADTRVSRRLQRYMEETIATVQERARPKLAWVLLDSAALKERLPASRRLERYLRMPQSCAVVTGTAGSEWSACIQDTDDPFLAYLYSCAGAALARDSLESARRELSQRHPELLIGDSLSPGTEGLPLALQKELVPFGLFEAAGVNLDPETLLMEPLASVTAFIGFGNAVERTAPIPDCGAARPRCAQCPYRNCSLRVVPYQPQSAPLGVAW